MGKRAKAKNLRSTASHARKFLHKVTGGDIKSLKKLTKCRVAVFFAFVLGTNLVFRKHFPMLQAAESPEDAVFANGEGENGELESDLYVSFL